MRRVWGILVVASTACSAGEVPGFSDGSLTFGPGPGMGTGGETDPGATSMAGTADDPDSGSGPGPDDSSGSPPDTTTQPPMDTGCVPQPEVCNGVDDDCNGDIDETDPTLGEACDTGMSGECGPGTQACEGGSLVCVPDARATAETCNGLDDDCDGTPDNGNPDGGTPCLTGLPGICSNGTEVCNLGSLDCEQDVAAEASDLCGNGLDDDCNGLADDGCLGCYDFDLGNAVPQSVAGSNVGEDDTFPAGCGGGGGADTLYLFEAPAAGSYTFDMIGSAFDTVLVAYSDCLGSQIACNDDFAGNPACGCCSCSEITLALAAGEQVIISVDGYLGATGAFTLNVSN